MTTQELYQRLSTGFNYNAALYFIYKIATTGITILLYNRFDSAMFSIYGNINSIIFLILLWLDFGLQKAIPRFCLDYARNNNSLKIFINKLIIFKTITLSAAIPLYLLLTHSFAIKLEISTYNSFFYTGIILLLTEGIVSIMRLIYHAYFLHNIFNSLNAITLCIDVTLSTIAITTIQHDLTVVASLILAKAIANLILIMLSWQNIQMVYIQATKTDRNETAEPNLDRQFVHHAAIMFFNNSCKSLSERNFLFPLFTITFGPSLANMFKVAQDGALLFYRIVIKTIGTTDTALFAHLLYVNQKDETWQIAFKKLCTKIAALVIPLLGILYIIYRYKLFMNYNYVVFQLFLIITICLLTETLFSPYERMLEVHRHYWLLACAYAPYLFMMTILFITNIMTSIGIFDTILVIHSVRLVSALIMVFITRMRYKVYYPIAYLLLLSCIILLIVSTASYLLDKIIPNLF